MLLTMNKACQFNPLNHFFILTHAPSNTMQVRFPIQKKWNLNFPFPVKFRLNMIPY